MSERKEIPPLLLQGIACLAGLKGCEIVGEPLYLREEKKWLLLLRLNNSYPTEMVPEFTDWCVLLDAAYPYGVIDCFPSKTNGIIHTYPHQNRNDEGEGRKKWRNGRICLDTPIRGLGVLWRGRDPLGDTDGRLLWYVRRALSWITAAAQGELLKEGQPFELPYLPPLVRGILIAHDEDKSSFEQWRKCEERIGIVRLEMFPGENVRFAVSFEDLKGKNIIWKSSMYDRERIDTKSKDRVQGIWWRWDSIIINPPWESPLTWGELVDAGKLQGVDVYEQLHMITDWIRDRDIKYLLLGFPIPEEVGGPLAEMYWQTVKLPPIVSRRKEPPPGHRTNPEGFWFHDRTRLFAAAMKIDYRKTQNWHANRLLARGRFAPELCDRKIIIIGCGALGSPVAELLARGGVKHITLMDEDILSAGNLVRHILTMSDIRTAKAESLRKRLLSINPHITVKHISGSFPGEKAEVQKLLDEADIVIDCTASDAVLSSMSQGKWDFPKIFFSVSLGFNGKKMFIYIVDGMIFPDDTFRADVDPWMQCERVQLNQCAEINEGVGCWSPLFPCRFDDVMLSASIAVKVLEKAAILRPFKAGLYVYEQKEDTLGLPSYNLIEYPGKENS